MSTEKRNQPWNETVEVCDQSTKKYKKHLKNAVCALFGLAVGFLSRISALVFILGILFAVYLLLDY